MFLYRVDFIMIFIDLRRINLLHGVMRLDLFTCFPVIFEPNTKKFMEEANTVICCQRMLKTVLVFIFGTFLVDQEQLTAGCCLTVTT